MHVKYLPWKLNLLVNRLSQFIVYSLNGAIIVTECISDHNDTNTRNKCLNLICVLNVIYTMNIN